MTSRTMHRKANHSTSIAAARSILPRLSQLQRAVLNVLRRHHAETGDGMTDLQLEQHEAFESRRPSTIRKRRLELQRKGYVADSGRTRGKLTIWIPVAATNIAAASAKRIPPPNPATIDRRRPTFTPRQITAGRREWTAEELALIDWFQLSREKLPTASFHLCPGVRVIGTARFYDALERQIRAGPNSPRARLGALQVDLKRLRKLLGRKNDNCRLV